MTANAIEIDRCLSTHLLSISDLEDLTRRTAALARGETSALSASSLPAPLALGAIAIDQARDPVERARALVRLAELAWKLLAFILMASLRGLQPGTFPGNEEPDPRSWPAPWRSLARAAARMLDGQPARVMELAAVALAPDRDGAFRAAMNVIAEAAALVASPAPDPAVLARGLPRLERAIRDTLAAFAPLRGWTLVAIVSAEVVDVDGTTQRIEYVDYTGRARAARTSASP